MCEAAGLVTQEPEVVGKQVALLMADQGRTGEFIYSAGGRNFEVEKGVFGPAARVAVGGDGEQEGWESLRDAVAGAAKQTV